MLIGPYLAIIGHTRNAVDHAAHNAARKCAVVGDCSGLPAKQTIRSYGLNENNARASCYRGYIYSECTITYNLRIPGGEFIKILNRGFSNGFTVSGSAAYKTE